MQNKDCREREEWDYSLHLSCYAFEAGFLGVKSTDIYSPHHPIICRWCLIASVHLADLLSALSPVALWKILYCLFKLCSFLLRERPACQFTIQSHSSMVFLKNKAFSLACYPQYLHEVFWMTPQCLNCVITLSSLSKHKNRMTTQ